MYLKNELTIWTDELVFGEAAIRAQYERYCQEWRSTFIKYDASIAQVYLPAIHALRNLMATFNEAIEADKKQRIVA